MNRKETTKFLGELITSKLSARGRYYASEVTIAYGASDVKRVDFMEFKPAGVTSVGSIEKGIFTCYEVKSCREDVFSGNGLNFIGEKNYIVTTMECYKDILDDFASGKLNKHIIQYCPDSSMHYGIMVAVPMGADIHDEFQKPALINGGSERYELKVVVPCRQGQRKRSITELLFYMLRSGH